MKLTFSVILFLVLLIDPTKIGKINAAKAAAKKTFNEGHYKEAVQKYRYLIDSLDVDEEEVRLNLAHAYYLSKDTASAKPIYQDLTQSTNNEIRSKALQQLGVLNNSQGKAEEALGQFKQAIKSNPNNQDARYNYEMLKKKLDEQKKKDQQQNKDDKKQDQNKDQQKKDEQNKDQKDQKNKDQQNKDQKDQEKKDQEEKEKKEQEQKDQQKKNEDQKSQEEKAKEEKEKKEKQGDKEQQTEEQKEQQKKENQKLPDEVKQKLEKMNISEQKAKMILEAMKNQEVQYLQQNKRKATKPKDKGKPDW
jgi:hypothetical protein